MLRIIYEWLPRTNSALDTLFCEIQNACEQHGRSDTLIRSYAAQDMKAGPDNRPFFDDQLATLLEGQEKVGTHGIVMMIRLPDFNVLSDTWGYSQVEEQFLSLANLLSTFMMHHPGTLLARYHRGNFVVLLPHRALREAESTASQSIRATDILPNNRTLDRNDMIHVGIYAWRSGQDTERVVEHAKSATCNTGLQGGNNWVIYDDSLPEEGRGNVRWHMSTGQMLSRGDPRLHQKPAVTREGRAHHRELVCRIFDGNGEASSTEYIPMVLQFDLSEKYDRLLINRLTSLLRYWPEENLAIQVTVEPLIRPRFQRWLRGTLMQCEKSQRRHIIIELTEADAGQHINRLQPAIRLVNVLGIRVAINQTGLALASTSWIKELSAELLKLYPGLVRNAEKRTENQLLAQSLVETYSGTSTQVYATSMRPRGEWQTPIQHSVTGGQGDFFASLQPLDISVKKYSRRCSV